jgi:subtilisin family serine protease
MMMRGTREPVRCILLSLVLVMAGAAALAQDAPRQATPRRNAVRPIEGRVSSNPRPAPTPAGDIFLEGHTITRQERSAVARHADGTPSRLSADTTATLRRMRVGATDKAVYLVRLNTLRVSEAKSAIEALGGEVLGYVRDAAFQVRMNAATAGRIGTLPQVEWIGPYKPEYKISRQLSDDVRRIQAATGPRAGQADAGSSGRSRSATDSTVEVNIYLFAHAALDRVASTVEALSGQVAGAVANDRLPKVRARISAGDLERVTLLPEVRLIERYVAPQLTNDKATSITRINEVWSSHGLTGAGQIVGHADTGLDVGTTGAAMHDDFEGRIAAAYALGRVGDWSDPQGHGTHTAGTILGNGAKSGGLYAGAAPDAQLVHQSVMDASGGLGGLPLDYGTLFQQAYDAGARIHSDSWGASTFGGYGDAVYLDAWTWNSGSPRNMLVVMAAGNDGPDASTVGSPGTAKNALTVGASETSRPALGSYADDIDEIAAFSSRGPTADGRIKPEVVAPGTWIASPRTQGDITPMEDDFETPLAWTKEPVAAPFTLTTADSRSGAQSYRHQRSGTAMFDDYLISPPLTLPAGNALSVNFWM